MEQFALYTFSTLTVRSYLYHFEQTQTEAAVTSSEPKQELAETKVKYDAPQDVKNTQEERTKGQKFASCFLFCSL